MNPLLLNFLYVEVYALIACILLYLYQDKVIGRGCYFLSSILTGIAVVTYLVNYVL
jgi:hypothetical protein